MSDTPRTPIGRRGVLTAGATAGALALFARNTKAAQAVDQPRSVTVVDVRAQGAVGDGITDDTAVFRGAFDLIAKAGGGIVFVPNGTYRVHGLKPPTCCTLRGESNASVLQTPPQSDRPAVLEISVWRVTIEHLTIDGSAPQQQGPGNGINISGDATDTRLRGLRIRRAAGHGIALTGGTSRARIERCIIEANGRNGVIVSGADDVAILGNLLLDNGRSAVQLEAGAATASRLSVLGNVIHGAGSRVTGAAAIRVDDACRDVLVSANTVSATAPGSAGIAAASSSTRPVESVTVSGNVVTDVGSDAIVAAGSGLTVAGNTVRGAAGAGIVASGDGVTVLANSVGRSARAGVRVVAAASALVVGNALWDNAHGVGSTTEDAALSVLGSPAGARGLLVANSTVTFTPAPALRLADTRAVTIGAGNSTGPRTGAPVATSGVDRYVVPTHRLGTLTIGATTQSIPHGRPGVPTNVVITMQSAGSVWLSAAPDATNLQLCADDEDRICEVRVG